MFRISCVTQKRFETNKKNSELNTILNKTKISSMLQTILLNWKGRQVNWLSFTIKQRNPNQFKIIRQFHKDLKKQCWAFFYKKTLI